MASLNASELKAGDRVGFVRYGRYGISSHGFATVERILTRDIVLDDGKRFSIQDGRLRADLNRSLGIDGGMGLIAASDLEERLAEKKQQSDRDARYHAFTRLVEETLRGRRNGYGNHGELTADEKAAIVNAAQNL